MPVNVVNDAVRAKIREYWDGHTLEQISFYAGCSIKTVSRVADQLGLPSKQRKRDTPLRRIAVEWKPKPLLPIARPLWFDDRVEIERKMMAGR